MSITLENLNDMPVAERIALVTDIWDSIAETTENKKSTLDTFSEKDKAVFKQRLAEHKANPQSSVSWEDVKAQL